MSPRLLPAGDVIVAAVDGSHNSMPNAPPKTPTPPTGYLAAAKWAGSCEPSIGQDPAGAHRSVAGQPAHHGEPGAQLELPDLAGLGAAAHPDLQRRLLAHLRGQASDLDGAGFQRMLGLGVSGDRRRLPQRPGRHDGFPRRPADVFDRLGYLEKPSLRFPSARFETSRARSSASFIRSPKPPPR